MSKVFIYDQNFDLGTSYEFGVVSGYKLMYSADTGQFPAAVEDNTGRIYGRLYDLDDDVVEELDIFYAVGIGLHDKVQVEVRLQNGSTVSAFMYEYPYVVA